LLNLVRSGVDVPPEVAPAFANTGSLEVEEHPVAPVPAQSRMNAVGQGYQHVRSVPVEQVFQLLEQHLRASQFCPSLFLIEDRSILGPNAPNRVECPRMYHFAQDAGVEQAQIVDGRNPAGEPLNQVE